MRTLMAMDGERANARSPMRCSYWLVIVTLLPVAVTRTARVRPVADVAGDVRWIAAGVTAGGIATWRAALTPIVALRLTLTGVTGALLAVVAAAEVVEAFVAAAVSAAVAAFVEAAVDAVAPEVPPMTMPPPSPPVITEVAGELIEELTVASGSSGIVSFATATPVADGPGLAGPSTRP